MGISVSGQSGDVTVNRSSLTFTTENWDEPQTVTVSSRDNQYVDGDVEVTLIHSASGGGYGGVNIDPVTVTVTEDDDESNAVELLFDPDSVREGGGQQRVTVTGELNAALRRQATTVTLTVGGGTLTNPDDYSADPATLTIPAGSRSGSANVWITPVDDQLDADPRGTVVVSATADSGEPQPNPSSFIVTIEDDDGPPTGIDLRVSPTVVSENGSPVEVEVEVHVTARFTGGGARTADTAVTLRSRAERAQVWRRWSTTTPFCRPCPP